MFVFIIESNKPVLDTLQRASGDWTRGTFIPHRVTIVNESVFPGEKPRPRCSADLMNVATMIIHVPNGDIAKASFIKAQGREGKGPCLTKEEQDRLVVDMLDARHLDELKEATR